MRRDLILDTAAVAAAHSAGVPARVRLFCARLELLRRAGNRKLSGKPHQLARQKIIRFAGKKS
jgi:hypothetical protein